MVRALGLAACLILIVACREPAATSAEDPTAAQWVMISDARARAMPPAAANSAAFMTLKNPGPSTWLVAAKADVSERVELHTHTEVDGAMQMRAVPRIEIPAGETVRLEPGGLHVMLIGSKEPLVEGHRFDLTLVFADGSETTLDVPVEAIHPPGSSRP